MKYSMAGLLPTLQSEAAFRQEVILASVLVPVAFMVSVDVAQRILLLSSVMLVMVVVELINPAIEATLDRVPLDHHPLVKRAKDMGSAAVFLTLANALLTWGIVFRPRVGWA